MLYVLIYLSLHRDIKATTTSSFNILGSVNKHNGSFLTLRSIESAQLHIPGGCVRDSKFGALKGLGVALESSGWTDRRMAWQEHWSVGEGHLVYHARRSCKMLVSHCGGLLYCCARGCWQPGMLLERLVAFVLALILVGRFRHDSW